MCYDVKFLTQKKLKYAKRRGGSPEEIKEIENKLEEIKGKAEPKFCVSGFSHPEILVFTNKKAYTPELFHWGLIPYWVRGNDAASKIQNITINARVETLFEKPSFKFSVQNKRCLVMVDGFYEHYYFRNKAYPHYIFHEGQEPMVMAGLWDSWRNSDGEFVSSVTIVTKKAAGIMKKIHNNPKLKEGRMPLILNNENQNDWLFNVNSEKELKNFTDNSPMIELFAHPVCFIRGKKSLGNVSAASDFFSYPELSSGLLF